MMKKIYKEVDKPISLAGCTQIFKDAGIPVSEYSTWNIKEIFENAEKIAKEQNKTCKEVFIQS